MLFRSGRFDEISIGLRSVDVTKSLCLVYAPLARLPNSSNSRFTYCLNVMAISETLRQQIIRSADYRCEYRKSSVQITGTPLVVDHIQAQSLGGSDNEENLAAACYRCNLMKGIKQQGYDLEIE